MNKKYIFISIFIFYLFFLCVTTNAMGADTAVRQLIARGEAFFQKGDFEHAALSWEQALGLSDSEKEPGIYLDTATHLANAYQSLGYHRKALTLLGSVLTIVEKNDDLSRNALFFNGLGDLHLSLGNIKQAADYLTKAMEKARSAKSPHVLAVVLNNVGNTLSANEEYESAIAAYEECLKVIQELEASEMPQMSQNFEIPDRLKSKVLMNSARAAFLSHKYKDSASALAYALTEIKSRPDSRSKASDFISLALLFRETEWHPEKPDNDLKTSVYYALNEAMRIAKDIREPCINSYAYGYMGQLYEDEGRYSDAMKLTRSAIFFAQQGNFSEILYLWQWQMGRLFKAKGDIKNAVKLYKEAITTLNPIRQEFFRGFRIPRDAFNEKVKPVYLELAGLLLGQAEKIKEEASKESRLREARDTMELLKSAELQDFFGDECVTALRRKDTKMDRSPPHTAMIYPISFPDRLVLLLTLADGLKQVIVPVDAVLLRHAVTRFRRQLQIRPNNRFLHDARRLYNWLIRPIESELIIRKVDTLIVAPDGAFRLIPFSTLHDGEQFLVEKYAIGTIPAITLTDPKPMDQENIEILLSGLSEGVQNFSPLPSVPAELRDIKAIMGGKVVLQDAEYTIDNLTREFKSKAYSVVHLATHGIFGGSPGESFLLSYDSRLTMDGLERLIGLGRFREQQVELLTLSACQSALGNERAALGLAGVAVKAGVRSAVATLWFVDDEATSLAIREFYRQLRRPDTSKAKALQNAQKKLISQPRYWHPAYWAPFLLIGNWL
ncbi:CHAT domain-containing protein [Desulfonema magnum]|uniref:Tetratricopeptide repeat-containing and CHAT domain-containing protein n=1 Tax=Desulfonema magnum TaxID=45655 RepID=A0A975GQ41_9BACT|nr:CHAT domain-containing protein [Desulfonema magnum]QTA89474.1 Tetratricopeptide repeat-containing and CHAT domain-containing protein [Desulfonema magnum]